MDNLKQYPWVFLFPTMVSIAGYNGPIDPITPKGIEYSKYGPLAIHKTLNFIRMHYTKALLNSEAMEKPDVNMIFTNLTTGESELLRDSIIQYDDVYTHN